MNSTAPALFLPLVASHRKSSGFVCGHEAGAFRCEWPPSIGRLMTTKPEASVRRRLDPLARKTSPLTIRPPRTTRFGSPLILSRVHWVEPKLVAEITYLTWTADNLLRHTVYVGLREDKPAEQVRRES